MNQLNENLTAYLEELSDLGRKYGFGLAGDIQLYKIERDDFLFDYSEDADRFLRLGNSNSDAGAGTGRDAQSCLDSDTSSHVNKKHFRVA